jgi:hypothetical protein
MFSDLIKIIKEVERIADALERLVELSEELVRINRNSQGDGK